MIRFAPDVAIRLFSVELATALFAVSAWADVSGVDVQIVTVREALETDPEDGRARLCVECQTQGERPIHRGELARYLEGALTRGYMSDVYRGRVRIEWFPAPYTPH